MANTYKKQLKTINVLVHGSDTPIEVADTVSAPNASNALAEFENFKTMHLVTDNGIIYVPFHAVVAITVTAELSDPITKEDPYCEDAGASE